MSTISIRPFIGAKDFDLSRNFYRTIGFEEFVAEPNLSVFHLGTTNFYLQRYYVQEWVGNTMIFLEVDDVDAWHQRLTLLNLPEQFPGAAIHTIRTEGWGRAFALIDPSGALWHVGAFC